VQRELEREQSRILELRTKEKDAKKSAEKSRMEMDTLRTELSKLKHTLKDADHQKDACLKDKRAASDAKVSLAKTVWVL
jgi:chromosome segregation ATPase